MVINGIFNVLFKLCTHSQHVLINQCVSDRYWTCHGLVCFGLIRRILVFPKGNNVDHLSMYLDVADSTALPYGWSRYAQFSLAVVNQVHSKYSMRKGIFFTVVICLYSLLFCHIRQGFFV